MQPLQQAYPEHHYYDPEHYHATLLALKIEDRDKIQPVLSGNTLSVSPSGLSMNRYGMAVPLYPADVEKLESVRKKLRLAFGSVHNYSEHDKVWEGMLWINFMRFIEKPSQEFFDYIREYPETRLDSFDIKEWELTEIRSRVLDPAKTTYLETYSC